MIGPKCSLGTFCLTNKGRHSQSFNTRDTSSKFGIDEKNSCGNEKKVLIKKNVTK